MANQAADRASFASSGAPSTGATAVVAALADAGCEVCFGLPGVHNLAIFTELDGSQIELVGVRHEQAAVYAADGYARVSARPGVAVCTTGPGAANAVCATGEAWASRSPVVVIATDIATGLRRANTYRGALHETPDQAAMFGPVTKQTLVVGEVAEIYAAVSQALELCAAAPSGPVYVEIPTDLLARTTEFVRLGSAHGEAHAVSEAELARATELLQAAERPLVWAGRGCVQAGAGPAVSELSQRLAAPVITTHGARGLVSTDHPLAVGLPPHLEPVGALWDRCDCVVSIASDLDGVMTQNWQMPSPARLVAINIDGADAGKNYPADVVVQADARAGCEALAKRLPPRASAAVADEIARLRADVHAELCAVQPEAMRFVEATHAVLGPDAVLLCDMCIPGYWLGGFYPASRPRRLLVPMGWGTLGFSFPAAIGAALATESAVVCVCGDGGFLFACGELATVAQKQLPVVCVIVDDGGYGMLRFDQDHAGSPRYGVDLTTPDFVALAHSFGIEAEGVDGLGGNFADALERAVAAGSPRVLVASCELEPPPTTSPRWYRSPKSKTAG